MVGAFDPEVRDARHGDSLYDEVAEVTRFEVPRRLAYVRKLSERSRGSVERGTGQRIAERAPDREHLHPRHQPVPEYKIDFD